MNSPVPNLQTPHPRSVDLSFQGEPHAALEPGSVVQGYQLLHSVGAGGTAQVFQAVELATGRMVAFKTALPRLRQNGHLAQRCRREMRIASRLAHENIVSVYDAGEHAGVPFLVMEWLSGENLRAHLTQRGFLEAKEAVRLMQPIFSAVAHGHGMGVIHRDIKLDNIVLHREYLPDGHIRVVPKLVDFGVSRLIGATALTLDSRASLLGTPQYMAPEQARGEAEIGPEADQHGLAVALYVLLCGHFPRAAANLGQLVSQVALSGFTPLSARAPSLDPELVRIVERGMACEPRDRYPSVAAFAAALAEWLRQSEADTLVEPVSTLPTASTVLLRGEGGESERHLEFPHPQTLELTQGTWMLRSAVQERTLMSQPAPREGTVESAPPSSLSAPESPLQVAAAKRSDWAWLGVAALVAALVVASLALSLV
ncbi:MAG: serine/threonine protein kinase [Polyangiaceae bacterium]|nr:serine/threonine protein kinase [Myxococcales bacterium]MCB9588294.1 serine/threonine protein kinase [Polyangiaceae bacterium]